MISIKIVYCLHIFRLVSGTTKIKQTESLSEPLTNFLFYEEKLFIGGVNRIYVFNKDLKQIQTANTCGEPSVSYCENINKILLAYSTDQGHVLVNCGTGNEGLCETRNLSDVESVLKTRLYKNYLKVSTNKNRPAVGLITEKREFIIALTFGDGISHSKNGRGATYKYAISIWELSQDTSLNREIFIKLQISPVPLHEYLIYYKVCFQYDRMLYFATNQKSEVGSNSYVSKIVRLCEYNLYSYTDIVISCNRSNVNYNLIQEAIIVDSQYHTGKVFIGVFRRGEDPEQLSGDSVICVTEMREIDEALTKAQRDYASCNAPEPNDKRYLPAYKGDGVCIEDITEANMTCNTLQTYSNVIGEDEINIEANVYTPEASGFISTLTSATYENKTVIMFGTSTGIMTQTVLLENNAIIENDRTTVDSDNEIRKIYAAGEDTVYAMSNKRVLKFATSNCSEFLSCADMTRIKHPLCGWCVWLGRATRRSTCSDKQDHWISSFGKCLSIYVMPSTIPLSTAATSSNTSIYIDTQEIPNNSLVDAYHCRFSVHSKLYNTSAAELENKNMSCLLPMIPVTGDVKIELLATTQAVTDTTLASASIQIYDCNQYKRCMECINTIKDKCMWCGQDANCQDKTAECSGPISNASKCPQLLDNHYIFIPIGIKKRLQLKVANAINTSGVIYRCVLPSFESVIATLTDEVVSCDLQVIHNDDEKKKEYKVIIKYGPEINRLSEVDHLFDNSVTIYSCQGMASDCSHCQALNKSRYNCSWGDTNECVHAGASYISNCPPPNIKEVIPFDGSIYGGTLVTIYGHNFGKHVSDIDIIKVADVPCDLINDEPVTIDPDFESPVPSRLICKTERSNFSTNGTVTVEVDGKLSNTNIKFSYKRPSISHIYPNFGPRAGGTKVTVYGKHLYIGNRKRTLFFGTVDECEQITEMTDELSAADNDVFECVIKRRMSTAYTSKVTYLFLFMDGKRFNYGYKDWFSFLDNPEVMRISPLKAFVSGGTSLTVEGKSLNNSHSSSVKLQYKEEYTIAKCDMVSESITVCRAPEAPNALKEDLTRRLSADDKRKQRCDMSIKVLMELNFDGVIDNFNMDYHNNPVFDILPEDKNVLTFDSRHPWIFLSGECFSTINREDIDVRVGNRSCIIIPVDMTDTSIKCFAPSEEQVDLSLNNNPEISVTLGNFHVTIGYLRYTTEGDRTMTFVYVSIAVFLIGIVLLGAFFICQRFRKLKNRVAYLEVKKGGVRRRHSEETTRQSIECRTSCGQSGVYDIINDEDAQGNPVEITGEKFDDKDDGYLVPHTYIYVDQIKPPEDSGQSNTMIKRKENTDKDAVNQDGYIHPKKDVSEGELQHVKLVTSPEVRTDELEKAEIDTENTKGEYVVSYSCNKLDTYYDDAISLEPVKADKSDEIGADKLSHVGDTSKRLRVSDGLSENDCYQPPNLDSNYIHPIHD